VSVEHFSATALAALFKLLASSALSASAATAMILPHTLRLLDSNLLRSLEAGQHTPAAILNGIAPEPAAIPVSSEVAVPTQSEMSAAVFSGAKRLRRTFRHV
jgi:hypothetical protein